jgi:hypothetical protein
MDPRYEILELYRTGEIGKICRNISGGHELSRDLEQESVTLILEKHLDKFEKMEHPREVRFYLAVVIRNLWVGKSSRFHAQYRTRDIIDQDQKIENIQDPGYCTDPDEVMAIIEAEIQSWQKEGHYPYDQELLRLIAEEGSAIKVSRETKIPYRSILWSLDKARKRIRKTLEKHGITYLPSNS